MRPLQSVLTLVSLVLVLGACSSNKIEKSQQEVRQEKIEKNKKQIEKKIEDKKKEESSTNDVETNNGNSDEDDAYIEEQTEDYSSLDEHGTCCTCDDCIREKEEQIEKTRNRGRFMAQGQEIPAPKDVPPIIERLIMNGNDVHTMIDPHFGYRIFETTGGTLYIIETELTTDEGHANFEKMCSTDPNKCFADGNYLVYKATWSEFR